MIATKKITHHTNLLNALIEKYSLNSYLELGINNPANNFDLISINGVGAYPKKVAVDPAYTGWPFLTGHFQNMTSDEFFKMHIVDSTTKCGECYEFTEKFDLIFIDGLHTAYQVKRDFENSLNCLSDNGFILIHDVLPENEAGTKVPRETRIWWGDVYKFAMTIHQYPGINFKTFNIDNGCMLVWKEKDCLPKANAKPHNNDWASYLQYRDLLMNVVEEVII